MNRHTDNRRRRVMLIASTSTAQSIVEANAQVLTAHFPAEYRSLLLLAWPLVMITLREVTTGALADK